MMLRNTFCAAILTGWVAVALLAPLFGLMPGHIDLTHILATPAAGAWLGYDDLGRPLLDRLLMGARTSCLIALSVTTASLIVGSLLGAASGYIGGTADHIMVRIIDIFLAFPGILLAIALAGLLGPGINNVIIALSLVGWVGYARLARAQVLSLRERDHVLAARALGSGHGHIIMRHLLPLIAAPLIVEATFGIAAIVIAEAGLSYLGLGVQPPQASWGSMIRDGSRYLLVAPHMVIIPGMALMLVVLAANLAGDRLRDRLDVKRRLR
jgi:peptide/nickel transport system permease protein